MNKHIDPESPTVPDSDTQTHAETEIEPASGGAADLGGAASLDKVRDILFGVQLREFERRFARLEDQLVKDTNDLKDDLTRRLDAVARVTTSLNDRISANQREFRQHQLDMDQRLIDHIRQQVDQLMQSLTRELDELRGAKTDRAALATLFIEMARKLIPDVKAPGNGGTGGD